MVIKIDTTRFYNTAKLAVIGDLMLDRYFNGNVDRISPEAPVPIVDVENTNDVLGGAANVMSNAVGLGAKVWGFGVVGDDPEGRIVQSDLIKRGVDDSSVLVDAHRHTTLKCRIMVGHHLMMRYDIEDRQLIPQNIELKLIDAIERAVDTVDMLVISDYEKGVMTPSLIRSILHIADKSKVAVLVDPKAKNTKDYFGANYVKMNLRNGERMTSIPYVCINDAAQICQSLSEMLSCGNVIVTMGKDGLSLLSNGNFDHIPALVKDVFDVTGAGDIVTSVLGIALANGYDLKTACDMSAVAAGIKVGKVGTYSLSREELMKQIGSYNNNNK